MYKKKITICVSLQYFVLICHKFFFQGGRGVVNSQISSSYSSWISKRPNIVPGVLSYPPYVGRVKENPANVQDVSRGSAGYSDVYKLCCDIFTEIGKH